MGKTQLAKPFVKWAGGKGQLLQQFDSYLPKELFQIKNLTYIEPFVGGGAMLFHMLNTHHNITQAVVNDINKNLVTSYLTIRDQPISLIKRLHEIENEYLGLDNDNRQFYFYEMRKRFNWEYTNDIENTSMFIFLNRTCFNGLYRENSKGEFNVPYGRYANPKICDEETIIADSEILQRVEILHGDYTHVEEYVEKDHTFIYFDPPYRPLNATSSFNSYVKEPFNDDEQIRLKQFFSKITELGCLSMLSNSDCSSKNPEDIFFEDIYKGFHIDRVYASRMVNANATKRGKLTELLIRNYPNKVGDPNNIFHE